MTKTERRKYAADWARRKYWRNPIISRKRQNTSNKNRSKERAVASKRWRQKNLKYSREQRRRYAENFRRNHPHKHYDGVLRCKYGIGLKEYGAIRRNQKGLCAICGNKSKPKRLSIDHDHKTGAIRGLLCHPCNNGLGCFRDDPATLKKALQYLLSHHAT